MRLDTTTHIFVEFLIEVYSSDFKVVMSVTNKLF